MKKVIGYCRVSTELQKEKDNSIKSQIKFISIFMPLISILIPTFNDLGGLTRIIEKIPLDLTSSGQIEVIISDDSSDQEIKNYFKNNLKQKSGFYFFRGSCEGAVKNWNFLLSKSKGRFIQFIHRDF